MNKQEAIERIEQMGEYERFVDEPVSKKSVLAIISKIDEPKKVVIPKFVAERIEYYKRCILDLQELLSCLEDGGELYDWAHDDNDDLISERVDMIARAWLAYPNIEVEQEKLYTVEIPNPNNEYCMNVLIRLPSSGKIALVVLHKHNTSYLKNKEYQLTESEIKEDFDFLWQFKKEVEEK